VRGRRVRSFSAFLSESDTIYARLPLSTQKDTSGTVIHNITSAYPLVDAGPIGIHPLISGLNPWPQAGDKQVKFD
jgi:hypothetical protein